MKTLHFASILVLASAVTFACGDDDDDAPIGTAGSSGAAGKNGTAGSNTAGKNGTAGSSTAGSGGNTAGTGGSTTDAGAGGLGGAGGVNEGGLGGVGGEGGAPFVCPPQDFGGAGGEFSGGAGGEGGGNSGSLEITGKWSTPFSTDIIRQDRWRSFGTGFDGTSAIVEYDNDKNVVYTESNCTFSKVVYTEISGGSFYSCTIAYGLPSLEAAKADTKVANPATPDASGCGPFPWSKLTKL